VYPTLPDIKPLLRLTSDGIQRIVYSEYNCMRRNRQDRAFQPYLDGSDRTSPGCKVLNCIFEGCPWFVATPY
jgi:hypothetical protein